MTYFERLKEQFYWLGVMVFFHSIVLNCALLIVDKKPNLVYLPLGLIFNSGGENSINAPLTTLITFIFIIFIVPFIRGVLVEYGYLSKKY